jgi:hypothetical protein
VAEALAVALPFLDPEQAVEEVAQRTAENISSMLQDVLRGAPTEVDAINGAVVRMGEQKGVPTPVNRAICSLVKALLFVIRYNPLHHWRFNAQVMLMLSLWIVLLVPVSVQAQGKLHLSLVSVDIWPEYDRPAVLMIYHITLAPDTVLPASLSLRVPSGAEINAVAVVDATGNLINAPYDSTNSSAMVSAYHHHHIATSTG